MGLPVCSGVIGMSGVDRGGSGGDGDGNGGGDSNLSSLSFSRAYCKLRVMLSL
jgi:hypothetical protein